MDKKDELLGYIEYLQKQMLTEGYKEVYKFENSLKWTQKNLSNLIEFVKIYPNIDHDALLNEYYFQIRKFEPVTPFDSLNAKAIFEPLFNEISQIAEELNIPLKNCVTISNSTSTSVTPLSRPTTGILFLGLGTYSFCNYWSKAFSLIANELAKSDSTETFEKSSFEKLFQSTPNILFLPLMLILHYGFFGTLVGFGKVVPNESQLAYRHELLEAMEVFIIAHEYIHFFAEENWEDYQGILSLEKSKKLELKCDLLGFTLCKYYGAKHNNWLAFSGAGPVIFFRLFKLCQDFQLLLNPQIISEESHPLFDERLNQIVEMAEKGTPDDQAESVMSYLQDVNNIIDNLENLIKPIISEAVTQR